MSEDLKENIENFLELLTTDEGAGNKALESGVYCELEATEIGRELDPLGDQAHLKILAQLAAIPVEIYREHYPLMKQIFESAVDMDHIRSEILVGDLSRAFPDLVKGHGYTSGEYFGRAMGSLAIWARYYK